MNGDYVTIQTNYNEYIAIREWMKGKNTNWGYSHSPKNPELYTISLSKRMLSRIIKENVLIRKPLIIE